ncbi:MAG: zinc metallopeptidase [bacterium]|nr:zinc metallopeptidase [bacterium]
MSFIVILLLIVAAVFGPQIWAKHVLAKHDRPRDDLAGSGSELARHLVDGLELEGVKVEPTDSGDHYDPVAKAVRLNKERWGRKSLTSLVVACHEVGHAIQDATGYQPFRARTRMVRGGQVVQKIGAGLMIAIPIVALLARSPRLGVLMFVLGLATLGTSFVIHLVTLPVEWDASFRRALPILAANDYISQQDQGAARQILTACALTYVAGSLASLLNLWRWLAILRR